MPQLQIRKYIHTMQSHGYKSLIKVRQDPRKLTSEGQSNLVRWSIETYLRENHTLLGVVNGMQQGINEIDMAVANLILPLSSRRSLERPIKNKQRQVETHFLLGKVPHQKNQFTLKFWHHIIYQTVLIWPYPQHFHDHCIFDFPHYVIVVP